MEQIAFRCQDINLAQYSFIAGKDYEKEKICQQYSMLGREKFKASGIVIYSQKFSTSTFEQVNAVLDAMVNLADNCCAEGADPNCYDEGVSRS
ncbi:Vitamin D-binding protein [Acipenser ruthenus]|uniref:Vitamin D-binding protein n=1 Tax=Acipenser ruthenus TaxID=7906 RepID=A0A444U632_ACIRT|nr:Vitamin D-binding protein [Acipenser ruthenus]